MPFIPHTKKDIEEMLQTIGASSIEQLFDEIPKDLRSGELKEIPEGLNEQQMMRLLKERALQVSDDLNFIGAGAYEHFIPAAVWDITSRGEFLTAYTPYQAEASQGTLQLIYEFQSMMTSLTGMDVSNASLYDGASALAEAVLMAVRANSKAKARKILIPMTVHPAYRMTVKTTVHNQKIECIEIPYDPKSGVTLLETLQKYNGQDIAGLVIPYPNFFGQFEAVDALTDWAHAEGALAIAVVNPMALAILKEPGVWGERGVDIVCGEAQPLGIPLASGGPYAGFMCCRQEWVRQMPGRIVGETTDKDGKIGYALTLQAREQHIRRSKATSNICTNQGLLVTAATIYMSLLGPEGLARVAQQCHTNTKHLVDQLTQISGVEKVFSGSYFHESVIRLPKAPSEILEALALCSIQGGYDLSKDYPELGNALLVCATETKSETDISLYACALEQVLHANKKKVSELKTVTVSEN
ncbi:MAG: aminomethyl-transferring glycine dehydrogenase subunit GcvPA [Proteobacteria bacterium]|nr:aminomethyl-transferring glycine dehydrogenase subunit GcvPA [Pseudomonadota bacterium]